ncbi:MAG: hypothetical protein K0U19_01330 [Proteobacteria bacterium]|nr:hypothetical protein [Pseudomonadota bacterium]
MPTHTDYSDAVPILSVRFIFLWWRLFSTWQASAGYRFQCAGVRIFFAHAASMKKALWFHGDNLH